MNGLQSIMAISCAPTMQENRSGAAGTAFRRLRNGREVYPDEQGSAPLRPIQSCKNYRNSGGSGNITPLPPLLLPPANTLIHNEIVQKVAEVVIKLQKKLVDGRLWAAVSVFWWQQRLERLDIGSVFRCKITDSNAHCQMFYCLFYGLIAFLVFKGWSTMFSFYLLVTMT